VFATDGCKAKSLSLSYFEVLYPIPFGVGCGVVSLLGTESLRILLWSKKSLEVSWKYVVVGVIGAGCSLVLMATESLLLLLRSLTASSGTLRSKVFTTLLVLLLLL